MKIGLLIVVFMLVLGIVAASVVFTPEEKTEDPAVVSRNALELYKNKHMYVDAVNEYKTLIGHVPDDSDYEIAVEMCDYIKTLDYTSDTAIYTGLQWALACAVSRDMGDTAHAEEYMDSLCEAGDIYIYEYVHALIDATGSEENKEKYAEANRFYKDYYDGIMGNYSIKKLKVSDVGIWQDDTYAFAKTEDGSDCIISTDGKILVNGEYGDICSYSYSEGLIAAQHEEQLVYINLSEQRKRVPYNASEGLLYYTFLGSFNSGIAPFCGADGKWGFVLEDMGIYMDNCDGATNICDGLFAFKKDGKWRSYYLKGQNICEVQGFSFDELYIDAANNMVTELIAYGDNSLYAVAYAKNSGDAGWYPVFIDIRGGKELACTATVNTSQSFEDVAMYSGGAGAVKTSSGWCYINYDGSVAEVLGSGYEQAASFGCNLAPVKKDGKWGYINYSGKMVIEPTFDSALPFSSAGTAVVVMDGEPALITLTEYTTK